MVDRARPEHPSVSVIIPVGGLDPHLDAQLQALADQDVGFPFEVLVADNTRDGDLGEYVLIHPLRERL
ncbi:MAG: glycosyl transferase, partial [Rhodococcus sp. (in: high G+C Gram-positive bacteria)]